MALKGMDCAMKSGMCTRIESLYMHGAGDSGCGMYARTVESPARTAVAALESPTRASVAAVVFAAGTLAVGLMVGSPGVGALPRGDDVDSVVIGALTRDGGVDSFWTRAGGVGWSPERAMVWYGTGGGVVDSAWKSSPYCSWRILLVAPLAASTIPTCATAHGLFPAWGDVRACV